MSTISRSWGRRNKSAKRRRSVLRSQFLRAEQLEPRALLAGDVVGYFVSDYWNSSNPNDVNADGNVSVLDLVSVINAIVDGGPRTLSGKTTTFDPNSPDSSSLAPASIGEEGEGDAGGSEGDYVDVNNDGNLNLQDLMNVISSVTAEGEGPDLVDYDVTPIVAAGTDADVVTNVAQGGYFELLVQVRDTGVLDLNGDTVNDRTLADAGMVVGTLDLLWDTGKVRVQRSEIQNLKLENSVVSGNTFQLSFAGETTANITFSNSLTTTARNIENALSNLAVVGRLGAGGASALRNFEVTALGTREFEIKFLNELSNQDVPTITGNPSQVVGGAATQTVSFSSPTAFANAIRPHLVFDATGFPVNTLEFSEDVFGVSADTGTGVENALSVASGVFTNTFTGTNVVEFLRIRVNALPNAATGQVLFGPRADAGNESVIAKPGQDFAVPIDQIAGVNLADVDKPRVTIVTSQLSTDDEEVTLDQTGTPTSIMIDVLNGDTDNVPGGTLAIHSFGNLAGTGLGSVTQVGNQLQYTPPSPTFSGTVTFYYRATDGTNVSNLAKVTVTVTSGPRATAPASYAATEQVALDLVGTLEVGDSSPGSSYTTTIAVGSGILTAAAGGTGANVSGSGTGTLTVTGNLTQINNFLDGLSGATITYTANSDNPSDTTLTISNSNGTQTGSDMAPITVTAVNDAPTVTAPASMVFTGTNTAIVFSQALSRLVTVDDADAATVQVTLAATNGTLTLDETTGLFFNSGANGTASMTFTGTLAAVKAALDDGAGADGLTFTPTTGFTGAASFSITVNDQGSTGTGGAMSANATVNILVGPLPIASDDTIPSAPEAASYNLFVLNNDIVHAGTTPVLDLSGGIPTVSPNVGVLTVEAADVDLDGSDFQYFVFTPTDPNFVGTVTFTYVMNENPATMSNGPDSANVSLTIANVNDAPVLDAGATPVLGAVNEDAGAPVGAVGTLVSDLVDLNPPAGGLDNVTDVDAGAATGVAITGANTASGTWFFSTNNGSTWTALGAVSDSSARLLAANANTRIYFQPSANFSGTVTSALTFRAWDTTSGTNGAAGANTSTNGGATAFSSVTDTADITVNAVNDAPTLNAAATPTLGSIGEDAPAPTGVVGVLLSSLVDLNPPAGGLDNVTDPDNVVTGVAITAADATNGDWFYSTDNGGTWNPMGTPTAAASLLLAADANTRVYFQPDPNFDGDATLTFRAWDQTAGTAGMTANTSTNGGATAFSSATDTATVDVTPANDAPVLADANVLLATITEDDTNNPGTLVSSLVDFNPPATGLNNVTDVDSGAVTGIAIVSISAGDWEFSTNGGSSWTDIGTVSETQALLLRPTDRVRYVPTVPETVNFTFRAWDQTGGTTGQQGTKVNVTALGTGGTAPFSTATDVATLIVSDQNDAPVLNNTGAPTLDPITEDQIASPGNTVQSIIDELGGSGITDADTGALEGIAIVATANAAGGKWQFQLDGSSTWTDIGTVSASQALLLRPADLVRYVPNQQNGETASITFRAWDQSGSTAGGEGTKVAIGTPGGTSPFSTATEDASITVSPVNDAPVLNAAGSQTLDTVVSSDVTNNGNTVAEILASDPSNLNAITDVDTGALEGIAVVGTTSSFGTWEFSTNGGSTWTAVGARTPATALLLRDTDRLRFRPDGSNGETATITYRAWDQTSGAAGGTADTTTSGGTTAFSTVTDSAQITVLQFQPKAIRGTVFIDANSNGFVDASDTKRIAGVSVKLTIQSVAVTGTGFTAGQTFFAETNASGEFVFRDLGGDPLELPPGVYFVEQVANDPNYIKDGVEGIGTPGPGGEDQFSRVTIVGERFRLEWDEFDFDGDITGLNFGEVGLDVTDSDLVDSSGFISEILASSSSEGMVMTVNMAGALQWSYCLQGWANLKSVDFDLDVGLKSGTLTVTGMDGTVYVRKIYDAVANNKGTGSPQSPASGSPARFRILGRGTNNEYVIRLDGDAFDFLGASLMAAAPAPEGEGEGMSDAEFAQSADEVFAGGAWA